MRTLIRSLSAAIATAALLALAGPAGAATIEINKTGDPVPNGCTANHCTLREAVLRANNQSAGPDTIVLPSRGRYELEIANGTPDAEDGSLEGDLDINSEPLTIRHPGRGIATIDANGLDRVIEAFSGLTLQKVGLTGGDANVDQGEDAGGGVLAWTRLRVQRSRIFNNEGDHGGGISGKGNSAVSVDRTRIVGNRDTDAGGGFYLSSAHGSITRSKILRNEMLNGHEGAGIKITSSTLEISDTTIAGNISEREGGGIVAELSDLYVQDSTVSGNTADDEGGGVYVEASQAAIVNSTIAGNSADTSGGGLFAGTDSGLSLNAVTIARNVANDDEQVVNPAELGGGIAIAPAPADPAVHGAQVSVRNSILALNRLGAGDLNDCEGQASSGGGNLLSTLAPPDSCVGFSGIGDAVRPNPKIGSLSRNGGPTATIPLLAGSPAIGRAGVSAPPTDQRGRGRDANPDSGAFER